MGTRKKLVVQTRYGFPTWVSVEEAATVAEANSAIERLRAQDDPMWAKAEYRVVKNRHDRS